MSNKRLIWDEISQLATRIADKGSLGAAERAELADQLGRLGKVQFKANALQEAALQQHEDTLSALQTTIARQEEMIAALQQNHRKDITLARQDLLLAILPAVDGLEAALASARRQLERVREGGDAYVRFSAWLDGLRLVHQRLLDVLAQAEVEPILAVGQQFNPRLHVASRVDTSGRAPVGTVVSEERRGYCTPDGVLRYAEVIVSRPAADAPLPLAPVTEAAPVVQSAPQQLLPPDG